MTLEELTQIATAHQNAIARHDSDIAEIRELVKLNQQQLNQLTTEQQLSRQDINSLTASILDLRNLVGDYIQAREERDRKGRDGQ